MNLLFVVYSSYHMNRIFDIAVSPTKIQKRWIWFIIVVGFDCFAIFGHCHYIFYCQTIIINLI